MRIAAVGRSLPPHYYDQETLLAALRQRWSDRYFNPDRLERLHKNVLVGGRHLALPIEEYDTLTTWGKANDAWIRVAQEVGAQAVLDGLAKAGLSTGDVDALIFVTVTGVATPSIDARLMNLLGLKSRVKRMPIFGLGCVAGAAGIARAADYLTRTYTLITTNVPYLDARSHSEVLRAHLKRAYAPGHYDLATAFLLRCQRLTDHAGSWAAVSPQNWLLLKS
ncbi:MAG TPA: hypothetical protein VII86_01050, partial [Thermoanaerobaculia bacterium]